MSAAAEARRQAALLAAIAAPRAGVAGLALREAGDRAARGLAAYRGNAVAVAERALAAACPTLAAMLGDDDFHALAREFWRAHPPLRGDLGEWGDALPGWVAGHAGLAPWPWLADAARLDLAVHRAERAADAELDVGTLALLREADPADLAFVPMPGTALVDSSFPVVTIHAAHHGGGGFDAVRAALQAGAHEAALVVRDGWRARVHQVDPGALRFWHAMLEGRALAAALDDAGAGFDFATWLADVIRTRAVKGLRRLADRSPSQPRSKP